uniref:Uncharacterized protein n=1 Tax=Nymphaea colorata TaxID=210225 RepID=A0A5K1BYD3_9MAGN
MERLTDQAGVGGVGLEVDAGDEMGGCSRGQGVAWPLGRVLAGAALRVGAVPRFLLPLPGQRRQLRLEGVVALAHLPQHPAQPLVLLAHPAQLRLQHRLRLINSPPRKKKKEPIHQKTFPAIDVWMHRSKALPGGKLYHS